MPWNLILLPLLGGFWFITNYYPTKFITIQLSRERLVFYSATATAAVVLAVLARLITLGCDLLIPNAVQVLTQIMPVPLTGTALIAFVLGPISAFVLNRWVSEADANTSAILKYEDNLEKIIATAIMRDEALIFSMNSGKVYIGVVIEARQTLQEAPSGLP